MFVSFRENPQYSVSADRRQARGRAGIEAVRHGLHHPAGVVLHGSVAHAGARIRCRRTAKCGLYGDGSQPISWISYRDVARAAAAAVTEPAARNMVVELGGPQALSPREVVRMFEAAGAGRSRPKAFLESALEAQMNAATDPLQKSFAGLMLQCAGGDAIDTTTSSRLFPFQMTSVRDFITAQLARRGRPWRGSRRSCSSTVHFKARPRGIWSRRGWSKVAGRCSSPG